MESGKKAVETVRETAANIGASAISGKDKTKATMQEKVDKMKAKDNFQKDLATERKEQRITEAELLKQRTQANNLDHKEARTGTHTTTGLPGAGTGAHHQMSAMPGHGTGQPTGGHVVEGTAVGSHPTGTGTTADTGAHQMSAMPGHGTGQPTGGHVVEGTAVGSHPIGTGTRNTADTGAHQMSAMPGHGTRQPTGGHVVDGTTAGSHPTGTGTTADNRHVGRGTTNTGLTGSG